MGQLNAVGVGNHMNDLDNPISLNKLEFSPILESVVDDMKNSLGLMSNALEGSQVDEFGYEIFRINSGLQHLQNLYRLQSNQLVIDCEECFLRDFIEDEVALFQSLLKARGVTIDIDCEESFSWFFDDILVRNILNSVLLNTIRYCESTIRITASEVSGQLSLIIEDDGQGYPPSFLLDGTDVSDITDQEWLSLGSAGLNRFFSVHVAALHKNAERSGTVKIENQSGLGGGGFTLLLP